MTEKNYYKNLEDFAKRLLKFTDRQRLVLERLQQEVIEVKTPESKLLYEAEEVQSQERKEFRP